MTKRAASNLLTLLAVLAVSLSGCGSVPQGNAELTANTRLELVDWHVTGLWIINCPVAWVRVYNYNQAPIKDVTFQYNTYDHEGRPLDQGVYTLEGEVYPGQTKNFIEQYLGLVHLHSDKLSLKLISVAEN